MSWEHILLKKKDHIATITEDVDMATIFKGTLPYVVVEFIGLLILIAFPQISLWLPSMMK